MPLNLNPPEKIYLKESMKKDLFTFRRTKEKGSTSLRSVTSICIACSRNIRVNVLRIQLLQFMWRCQQMSSKLPFRWFLRLCGYFLLRSGDFLSMSWKAAISKRRWLGWGFRFRLWELVGKRAARCYSWIGAIFWWVVFNSWNTLIWERSWRLSSITRKWTMLEVSYGSGWTWQ